MVASKSFLIKQNYYDIVIMDRLLNTYSYTTYKFNYTYIQNKQKLYMVITPLW